MIGRIALAWLVAVGIAWAAPATAPTTVPTSQPASRFPTPAELIAKMRQLKDTQQAMPQVAYFDLSRPITEQPEGFSLFGGETGTTLRSLLHRLRQARDDQGIRAVLLTLDGPELNLSQAQELRDALAALSKAGKRTFVYADAYDTARYTLASGATDICLLEGGEIMLPGLSIEATFARQLLDKLGVKADYVQIGEYKGADESFTRTGPSDELRGELNRLMDSLFDQVVSGIAKQRKLTPEVVRKMIDQALIPADDAKKLGLVDHLVDMEGLRRLLGKRLGGEVNLVHNYGRPKEEEIDFSNPFALFSLMMRRPQVGDGGPAIAVIYAEGMIIDGEGGQGLFGGNAVGSRDIRQAFRLAARDQNVKAIVLRIDSPGGSALASEAMWQAARQAAKDKPLIVSVGSMAASGGYYLACAGDTIYADPTAIVGSIGVVGGKFVTKDLFDKIGLTSEPFSRGANADLFSSNQPFTDQQRDMVTKWMQRTYQQFTQRVMATRQGKIKDIDQVARGRIFAAREAQKLGMVDRLGGLEDALAFAAKKAGLEEGKYEIRVLPPAKTLADYLYGADQETALPLRPALHLSPDSFLPALPLSSRQILLRHVQLLQLLEQRPVVLLPPYVLQVK